MAIDNYTLHYINYKKENLIYTRNSLFVSQSIKDIKSSGSAISRYFLLKIYGTEMGINLRRRPDSWRFAMRYYNVITDCVWDQWAATSLQFQMDGVIHMDFLSTIFVKIHWKTNSQIQFCILVFKKKKKKFFFLSVCNVNDSCLKKICVKTTHLLVCTSRMFHRCYLRSCQRCCTLWRDPHIDHFHISTIHLDMHRWDLIKCCKLLPKGDQCANVLSMHIQYIIKTITCNTLL